MKRAAIIAVTIPVTASLLGYWLFSKAVEAVGSAVENLGDLSPNEDWDWDDWDEWDGVRGSSAYGSER
jgi:hypothetical protein